MTYIIVSVRSIWFPLAHIQEARYDIYHATFDSTTFAIGALKRLDLTFVKNQYFFKFKLSSNTMVGIGLIDREDDVHGSIMTIIFNDLDTPTVM